MNILELARKYGEFYVPAFTVKVKGQDLVRKLFLTVTNASVDLQENAAGRFSFTVANAFNWERQAFVSVQDNRQINLIELFAFGSEVEMQFGYGDPSTLTTLLRGTVSEISTNFGEGGSPELTVSGQDKLNPLTSGKRSQNWENKRDSDVVRELASTTGLAMTIQDTNTIRRRIDRGQQTPMDFIKKLADNNDFIYYVQNDKFYFGPKKATRSADLELEWGKGLLTFAPEANLAKQVGGVEVRGVSAERGEALVGRAEAGGESQADAGSTSGSSHMDRTLGAGSSVTVRSSVHTQEEADQRARAIRDQRSEELIKGNGESIGLPEILPNTTIDIKGLGKPFSQIYRIISAKHTISSSGYRTSWVAKQRSTRGGKA